jgi:hypothetical protein
LEIRRNQSTGIVDLRFDARKGISSARRFGKPQTSSPCCAIGRAGAFSKSAMGKTDVSFDI